MCETRKRIEIKQIAWRIIKPTNVVIISTSVILNSVFPLRFVLHLRNGQKKQIVYVGLRRNGTSNAKSRTFRGICYCIHYRSWTWYFSIDIKENIEMRYLVKQPDRSFDPILERKLFWNWDISTAKCIAESKSCRW